VDPNTTLDRIRVLQTVIHGASSPTDDILNYATELADLTENLDEWLCRGGFLPDAWRR
jgi:hypothetical protein